MWVRYLCLIREINLSFREISLEIRENYTNLRENKVEIREKTIRILICKKMAAVLSPEFGGHFLNFRVIIWI